MSDNLPEIYRLRFKGAEAYRLALWQLLISDFFGQFLKATEAVLDLGCGYGEFINSIKAKERIAMDLNPHSERALKPGVKLLLQDASTPWPLPANYLDLIFTSNFFEHLPDKGSLSRTLSEALRCLKPGGRLVAMGPNIKYLPGQYWDFWDHYLPLTELSLSEGLRVTGFEVQRVISRFLPFTISDGSRYPLFLIRLYLKIPSLCKLFGRQFLVVAVKPN